MRAQLIIDFEKDTKVSLIRRINMANNKTKKALEQFKMEAANEVGVNLNQGYNGDLTSRQAGSIGGQMVKKMVEKYENDINAK